MFLNISYTWRILYRALWSPSTLCSSLLPKSIISLEHCFHPVWDSKVQDDTSSSEPSMLTTLWCKFRSIIQMQRTLWGHRVRPRVDSNLAESPACSQFVATHMSLCWGSSAATGRKTSCSNRSLMPVQKKLICRESFLCGQQTERQLSWFEPHSFYSTRYTSKSLRLLKNYQSHISF